MTRPEIQKNVKTGKFDTNYLEQGKGYPLIFIHGSGPGVSAYANWRLVLPQIAEVAHCYAPDMIGFGYSSKPTGDEVAYGRELWTQQIVDFMDALGIEKADFLGNSFGGSLAISMVLNHPERVRKVITMGAMGPDGEIPEGLDKVWGYEPSPENMMKMINLFTYNKKYATQELANIRYQASVEPGFHEAFGSMFPAPRQPSFEDLSFKDEEIATIKNQALIVHGREDQVIPVSNSYRLINLLENAELHVFGGCGHWTQIEKSNEFAALVKDFLTRE